MSIVFLLLFGYFCTLIISVNIYNAFVPQHEYRAPLLTAVRLTILSVVFGSGAAFVVLLLMVLGAFN